MLNVLLFIVTSYVITMSLFNESNVKRNFSVALRIILSYSYIFLAFVNTHINMIYEYDHTYIFASAHM